MTVGEEHVQVLQLWEGSRTWARSIPGAVVVVGRNEKALDGNGGFVVKAAEAEMRVKECDGPGAERGEFLRGDGGMQA